MNGQKETSRNTQTERWTDRYTYTHTHTHTHTHKWIDRKGLSEKNTQTDVHIQKNKENIVKPKQILHPQAL